MTPPSSLDATCQKLFELTQEESTVGKCTLVGFGAQASAQSAAFLNGCCVHALDYDDTIDTIAHHPSAQTVPAALAVAQSKGSVSGKDLITSVIAGSDLGARLSAAPNGELGRDFSWFPISNFGVFAATAAAACIKVVVIINTKETLERITTSFHTFLCHQGTGDALSIDKAVTYCTQFRFRRSHRTKLAMTTV